MATAKTTKAKTKTKAATARKTKAPAAETKLQAQDRTGKRGRVGGKACKMSGCKREYRAKGYCGTHYKQWRQGAFGKARYTSCSDYGCFRPQALNRHGLCEQHFQDYYVKGMERARVVVEAPKEEKKAADEKAA